MLELSSPEVRTIRGCARYTTEHTNFLLKKIKSKGPANVRVELVDHIPLGESGKIERVVSKFGEEYGYFGRQPSVE